MARKEWSGCDYKTSQIAYDAKWTKTKIDKAKKKKHTTTTTNNNKQNKLEILK